MQSTIQTSLVFVAIYNEEASIEVLPIIIWRAFCKRKRAKMSTSRYANAGKRGARDADDDDEERVVYYDLDAGSRRNSLLLYSPENPKQNVHSAASKDHPSTLNRSSSNFQQKKGLTAVSAAADRKCGATSNASGIFERPKEIFHQQPLFHLGAYV